MFVSPFQFLVILILAGAGARIAFVISRKRRRRELQELARSWRMHYSPYDRFALSDRVAQRFPLPGAAELRAVDLIYGTERDESGEFYRYVFCAEFTIGVTRGKQRQRRVATLREPKAKSADWSALQLASEELPTIEQYRQLKPPSVATTVATGVTAS